MRHLPHLSNCYLCCMVISFIVDGFIHLIAVYPNVAYVAAVASDVISKTPSDTLLPRTPIRRDHLVPLGQSINLTCPYDTPFYSWTKMDESKSLQSDKGWLLISVASPEDSGRYRCQAIGGYGIKSAELAVRVVDPNSYLTQRECASGPTRSLNPEGPCFLKSYTDHDLNPVSEWGESILLDCDAVTSNSAVNSLHYQWRFIRSQPIEHGMFGPSHRITLSSNPNQQYRLLIRSSESAAAVAPAAPQSDLSHPNNPTTSVDTADNAEYIEEYVNRLTKSQLKISKLDLSHAAEYQCVVSTNTANAVSPSTISRLFRLTVNPRKKGKIILGPNAINQTVLAGEYASFGCEINPKEHRSSTMRWGKSIKVSERSNYEARGREVIQWAGGTFVVLPSVRSFPLEKTRPNGGESMDERQKIQKILGGLPSSGVIATESTISQSSQLILPKAKQADSGRYVCSVLTEGGRDGHKFVHITVISASGETIKLDSDKMRQLSVYIAVPTIIFFICLCVVTYCLISRRNSRSRRIGSHRNGSRGYYGPNQLSTQIKSPSAASSSSVGMNRNGVTQLVPSVWNTSVSARASGPGTVIHSSNNGSNSLSGTAPLLLQANQSYQAQTMPIPPSAYPVFYQKNAAPFYTLPDPNNPHGYILSANMPVNNGDLNKPTLPVNYPVVANGHFVSPNSHSMINPSPNSSAVSGINEGFDGRLLHQSSQSPGPGVYHPINHRNNNNTNSVGYHGQPVPTRNQSPPTHNPEFEMTQTPGVSIGPAYHQ